MPSTHPQRRDRLRATAAYLADLLVEDLANDGAALRKRVPELLDTLVKEGRSMRIDDAYQLQTEEGAEWEKDYQSRLAAIRDDAGRISQLRNERLARSRRRGARQPEADARHQQDAAQDRGALGPGRAVASEGDVPVWVRDEWSVTEAAAKKSAAEAGDESPIVFVFLPKREADQIKETLASYTAAQETVQQKPTPQTDAGKAAQRAMMTRVASRRGAARRLSSKTSSRTLAFSRAAVPRSRPRRCEPLSRPPLAAR